MFLKPVILMCVLTVSIITESNGLRLKRRHKTKAPCTCTTAPTDIILGHTEEGSGDEPAINKEENTQIEVTVNEKDDHVIKENVKIHENEDTNVNVEIEINEINENTKQENDNQAEKEEETENNENTTNDNSKTNDVEEEAKGENGRLLPHGQNGESAEQETTLEETGTTCSKEFKKEKGHTMCFTDDPRVIKWGISSTDRRSIVDFHNEIRAKAKPSATDLAKLVWDDKLAVVSEKWAKQCKMEHDKNRRIPSYGVYIGQNVAAGFFKWIDVLLGWYNEYKDYRFGQDYLTYLGKQGLNKIGHYTQMVSNNTVRVGCGFAACKNTKYYRYYVCNYAVGQSNIAYPYTKGTQCSSCPNSCRNGLCDCGGLLCHNGGKLNKADCTCTCPSIYTGSNCSQLTCPPKDEFYCGTQLLKGHCTTYANVPALCPYMCGICGQTETTTPLAIIEAAPKTTVTMKPKTTKLIPSTPKPTTASPLANNVPYTCPYRGKMASSSECKRYGNRGMDTKPCASVTKGGQFDCSSCIKYWNVKKEYCPVMCGLCEAPCNGKQCLNGGMLNPDTCTCTCKKYFTGSTCEGKNCPDKDQWSCGYYQRNWCTKYINIPDECPYLCGTC